MIPPGWASRGWRWAVRIGKVLEGLTKSLGPIVAALWIAWQYHQSQLDKRVEATLAYVTRYESAETSVGKAQRALTASLWDHAEEIAELGGTRASAEDVGRVRTLIVKRVIDAAGSAFGRALGTGPLDELDDFYNALVTCVQGRVCDEEAAVKFFGCAADVLVGNFGPVLDSRGKLAPRFGWGARWIAGRSRESGTCRG